MSNQLSVVERGSLRKHEAVIEKGMATFIEVGIALKTIRDDGLYRESFKTFEKYVDERWGMQRAHAYRLISAAEVKADLSPIGDKMSLPSTESAFREVAKAPKESRAEVVEIANTIAASEDRKPTANDFRNAVEIVTAEPKTELLDAEPEQTKPNSDVVIERAKQRLEDHLRGVILQFGHLGIGGQADAEVKALRRKAGI